MSLSFHSIYFQAEFYVVGLVLEAMSFIYIDQVISYIVCVQIILGL